MAAAVHMVRVHYKQTLADEEGFGKGKQALPPNRSCIFADEEDFGKGVQASRIVRYLKCAIAVCCGLSIVAGAVAALTVEVPAKSICDESWFNKTVQWHGRIVKYMGSSYEVRVSHGRDDCSLPREGIVRLNLPTGFPSCSGEPTARGGDDVWFEGSFQEAHGDQITIQADSLDFHIATHSDGWEAFRRNCGTSAVKRNPCLAQGKFQAHYFLKRARNWQGKVLSILPGGKAQIEMSPSDSTMPDLVLSFNEEEENRLYEGNFLSFSAEFAQLADGFEFGTRMGVLEFETDWHSRSRLALPKATWDQFLRICGERSLVKRKPRKPRLHNVTQREFQKVFSRRQISWAGTVFHDVGPNDLEIKVKMSPSESLAHDVLLKFDPETRKSWESHRGRHRVRGGHRMLREGMPIIFSGEVTACGALTSSFHEIVVDHVEAQHERSEEL